MQISVKLHRNQSCKSLRFSIWAPSLRVSLYAFEQMAMRGRWVRFEEREERMSTRGGGIIKEEFDKEEDMKYTDTHKKRL